LGFDAEAILIGDLAIWRLSSCLRALVALGADLAEAVEAGAGYAMWAPSPGITTPLRLRNVAITAAEPQFVLRERPEAAALPFAGAV